MKTIAEQDAALPPCRRPDGQQWRCTVCLGSQLQHHWMFGFLDDDVTQEPYLAIDGEPFLKCRHCEAKIEEFDCEDTDCPEI